VTVATAARLLCVAVAVAALTGVAPAAALDSDAAAAVTLEADDFEFDLDSGARIYRGRVLYRQGSIRVTCDELNSRHGDDGELRFGVCAGGPAKFQQSVASGDGLTVVHGQARAITFDRATGRVVLDGDAQVAQGGERLSGARITYDLNTRKARVTGGDGERARVQIPSRAPAATN